MVRGSGVMSDSIKTHPLMRENTCMADPYLDNGEITLVRGGGNE